MAAQPPPNTPVIGPTHIDMDVPPLSLDEPARDDSENIPPGATAPGTSAAVREIREATQRLVEALEILGLLTLLEIKPRRPRKALRELKGFNEQKR